MGKLKNKKVLITIILVVIAIIILTSILIANQMKKRNGDNIQVAVLEKVKILSESDSYNAAELIKKNIVKITNTTNAGTITGTGFFHETGYLVTNSHLVDIEGKIEIEYYDGNIQQAFLAANDITSDIALLKVDKPKVKALAFGNTLTLKVTDELYAIGYPYGLEGEATVTKGILSARRSAGGIEYLQTDISLNTGNSGGPLINDKAEVFGMTTYAAENASFGMSISAENLENIISRLLEELEIEYLEDERPSNALNTVLIEIGHNDEDIYKQKDILEKIKEKHKDKNKDDKQEHLEENEEQKENQKPNNNGEDVDPGPTYVPPEPPPVKVEEPKSKDATLKTLSVKGYTLAPVDNIPNEYRIELRNKMVSSLDITAIANDEKATVKIEGNENFQKGIANEIKITVIAEDGHTQEIYIIYLIISKSTFEGYGKLGINVDREYVHAYKENCVYIEPYYMTADGVLIGTNEHVSVVDHYEVEIHEGFFYDVLCESRLLKKYNIYPTGVETASNRRAYIRYSEIKALLNDEDYKYDNQAKYSINVKAVGYDGKTAEGEIGQMISK